MTNKNKALIGVIGLVGIIGTFVYVNREVPVLDTQTEQVESEVVVATEPIISPISHASFVFTWGDMVVYNDPVGDVAEYAKEPAPQLILLSDVHGDHLSTSTLSGLVTPATKLIVPQAVYDLLPGALQAQSEVLANDATTNFADLTITAVPMYNYPEVEDSRHAKGRGNGYIVEREGMRMYIAGDTAVTPEMRALTDIDIAFVPMNLPYTMGVEEAASAVLDFAPVRVYPYHYRTPEGPSDVAAFKSLVETGNQDIEVVLLQWY